MPDTQAILAALGEEAVPTVDWDAPEQGQIPPPINPGLFTFKFWAPEKAEDRFDTVQVEVVKGQPKRSFPRVLFEAEAILDAKGQPYAIVHALTEQATVVAAAVTGLQCVAALVAHVVVVADAVLNQYFCKVAHGSPHPIASRDSPR